MTTGTYSKEPIQGAAASGGIPADGAKAHTSGVKETLSPAMDILVSSNFERLLACLAFEHFSNSPNPSIAQKLQFGKSEVMTWLSELKSEGRFAVPTLILEAAQKDLASARVDDEETVATIRSAYDTYCPQIGDSEGTTGKTGGYILDPHSAVGIAASVTHVPLEDGYTISLATAHPAKFNKAVDKALQGMDGYDFEDVLPQQFKDLDHMPRKVLSIAKEDRFERIKSLIDDKVPSNR